MNTQPDIIIIGHDRTRYRTSHPGRIILVDSPSLRDSLSLESLTGRIKKIPPENDNSLFINTIGDVKIVAPLRGIAGTPVDIVAEGAKNFINNVTNTYEWTVNGSVVPGTSAILSHQYPLVTHGKDVISVKVTNSVGNSVTSKEFTIESVSDNEIYMQEMYTTLPDIIKEGSSGSFFIRNITLLTSAISVIMVTNVNGMSIDRYQVPNEDTPFLYLIDEDKINGDIVSFDVEAAASDGTRSKRVRVEIEVTDQDRPLEERINVNFPPFVTTGQSYSLDWNIDGSDEQDYELLLGSLSNATMSDTSNIPINTLRDIVVSNGLNHGDDILIPWFLMNGSVAVLNGLVSSNARLVPPDINGMQILINGSANSSVLQVNTEFTLSINQLPTGTTVRYISQELATGATFNEWLDEVRSDTSTIDVKVPALLADINSVTVLVEISNGSSSSYRTIVIPVQDLDGHEVFTENGTFTKPNGVNLLSIVGHGGVSADATIVGDVNLTFPQVVDQSTGEVINGYSTDIVVEPVESSNYTVTVPDGARIVMRW